MSPAFLRWRSAPGIFAAALLVTVSSCDDAVPAASATDNISVLSQIPDSALAQLAQRRIFFGHQSVGSNLLDGVAEIMAGDPRLRLRVVKSDAPHTISGAGIFHAFVGENRRPDRKNADFARIVNAGFGADGDVALLKYCYLDVGPATDVEHLFADYRKTVDAVRAQNPRLTVVSVTQPLTVTESAIEARVRGMLGRTSERALNAKRERFNALMRATYGADGTLFDLARIESTQPDGSRLQYTFGSDTAFALVPAYTDDGGHLNALGRRVAAEQFVAFLAGLRPSS
jgi:hypothetical protein